MDNPALDIAILELLEQANPSEFELIKALQAEPYQIFNQHIFDNDLSLFQTHFIVYNALYRLRDLGLEHKIYNIDILATKISKVDFDINIENKSLSTPTTNRISNTDAPETEKLRTYYLDWDNFLNTDEHQVKHLLDSFWIMMSDRFGSADFDGRLIDNQKQTHALKVLELTERPTKSELKQQYRKLCLSHHPDKGGERQRFQQILLAYQYLNKSY